jgi:hypothetical protein
LALVMRVCHHNHWYSFLKEGWREQFGLVEYITRIEQELKM